MLAPFKKLLFTFIFNLSLFLVLMIGIQNSTNRGKVNLIGNNSVKLPIGFIIGISFISGSISGSLLKLSLKNENV